jgi:hypothetical protein
MDFNFWTLFVCFCVMGVGFVVSHNKIKALSNTADYWRSEYMQARQVLLDYGIWSFVTIETEEQYKNALDRADRLFGSDPESFEGKERAKLEDLIEDYERIHLS